MGIGLTVQLMALFARCQAITLAASNNISADS